jgi:hypothetical protein
LNEIQETGAIAYTDDGYALTDDTLRSFLGARTRATSFETGYCVNGVRLVPTSKDTVDETPTALSAVTGYGVDSHPANTDVSQADCRWNSKRF